MDSTNRWVKLATLLNWDALAGIYIQAMSSDMGRTGTDARIVIGALIIKYLNNLDDRSTIEEIQENPYLQYFIGLDGFTHDAVFDASQLLLMAIDTIKRSKLSVGCIGDEPSAFTVCLFR